MCMPEKAMPAESRQEGENDMLYVMVCKQHRHEEKRFWVCQERQFVMPVLEKQIMPGIEALGMKTG